MTPTSRDIPELLAPAGDREAFLAAVSAGADAIYCGVTGQLNARRRAGGIAPAELAGLCELAHGHGVRVYVTMNVVVKQAELEDALAAAKFALDAGADASSSRTWALLPRYAKHARMQRFTSPPKRTSTTPAACVCARSSAPRA